MPLINNADTQWDGWLIDNLGGRDEEYQKNLVSALQARRIPKSNISTGTVNMWFRPNSRYIDVVSDLDGKVVSTIHIQEYGSSLWVGRAILAVSHWNYYKRMAAVAFVLTIDRCIRETVLTMADESAIHIAIDFRK